MPVLPLIAQTSVGALIATGIIGLAVGAGGIWFWFQQAGRKALDESKRAAERELSEARGRRDEILKTAEVEAQKKLLATMERFESETAETRKELKASEKRLARREDEVDKKFDVLTTKEKKIEDGEARITKREAELDQLHADARDTLAKQRDELLRISKMTLEEAREACLRRLEIDLQKEAGQMVEKILGEAQDDARDKARKITIEAIQRYAAEHTAEATVATVDVPSDDMKGRIIGREGRNIRAFEKATGVTVIVDDTPGVVTISCFDPVRKEIARQTLSRLIQDGRIHPTRIEELTGEVREELDQKIVEYGKHAAMEANVHGLPKRLIETLGRLHFRTSYGQNVLRHSIEVAHLTGIMADELKLDGPLARRCGLLHDIGKAIDHDMEGSHTKIGADLCRKLNEHPAVVNAAEGHHGDVAASHVFTPLVTAADAVSASRPGGRRESLERYIQRLEQLEGIATSFSGVNQAYAVEAGREIRVVVDAVRVDDMSSLKLARDIAEKIQETMTYPGEIKVTVLRELRAVEYAR